MKQTKDAERKPKLVGMNHVALEVGDVEAALAFYGRIFEFTLRGRSRGQAFIDMGDQFIALMETRRPHRDRNRHFGLVVDDRSRVVALAKAAGATMVDGPFLDFLDPWGNRIEVIEAWRRRGGGRSRRCGARVRGRRRSAESLAPRRTLPAPSSALQRARSPARVPVPRLAADAPAPWRWRE